MINLTTYVWHVTDILYANKTGNATHPLREAWHGVNSSESRQLYGGCEWSSTRRRTICTIEYGVIDSSGWNIERTGWDWFKNFEHIRSIAALPSAFGFSHRSDENSYSSFVFALNILVSTGVLALLVIIKLIREDRVFKVVHATSSGAQNEFTRLTLDAWDHGECVFLLFYCFLFFVSCFLFLFVLLLVLFSLSYLLFFSQSSSFLSLLSSPLLLSSSSLPLLSYRSGQLR